MYCKVSLKPLEICCFENVFISTKHFISGVFYFPLSWHRTLFCYIILIRIWSPFDALLNELFLGHKRGDSRIVRNPLLQINWF